MIREMIALFGETGAASKARPSSHPTVAGSAWFLADPVSAAVTNADDCPFPLASK
jgi:hypothetical protein